jgi:phosphoglycolate phosphatase
LLGDGVDKLIERVLAARHCAVPHGVARQHFLEHYEADLTTLTQPYPGTQDMLGALRAKGLHLAVCTNKPTHLAHAILKRLALDGYFAHVLGGDALPFRKPDPRVLWETVSALRTTPASAVFVGDSEVDAATAAAAGVPFLLMAHGYHRGPVADIPCCVVLENFEQLAELLR